MQSEQLTEIIKNPYNLNNEDIYSIENICNKYPYCQTAQILLAKYYQKNNSHLFEKQVNLASAYSIDRRQFQNYISEKQHIYNIKSSKSFTGQNKTITPVTGDDNTQEERKDSKDENKTADSDLIESSKDVNSHKTKHNYSDEERKKHLEQIVKNRLNSIKTEKKDNNKQSPIIPTSSLSEEAKAHKKNKSDELIEKFIREEPRINSPKDTMNTDDNDLSEESVRFKDDIISETLAEIYFKQGKIDRSLNIYNKLSLQFPEKSSYFAKKIEHIKNNI